MEKDGHECSNVWNVQPLVPQGSKHDTRKGIKVSINRQNPKGTQRPTASNGRHGSAKQTKQRNLADKRIYIPSASTRMKKKLACDSTSMEPTSIYHTDPPYIQSHNEYLRIPYFSTQGKSENKAERRIIELINISHIWC